MNKFSIVLWHTFKTNAMTKTFVISTIVTALIVGIIFNLPNIMSSFDKDKIDKVGMIDPSHEILALLQAQMSPSEDVEFMSIEDESKAKEMVEQEEVKAYIHIKAVNEGMISATYQALDITDSGLINRLEQGLSQVQFRMTANHIGLDQQDTARLFQTVTLEKNPLNENAKTVEEVVQSQVLVYILLFAIYISVLMFGNLVAMEVIKEKTSRVMEILVSSVNPIAQMFGKILGVALLGLFQLLIFVSIGFIALQFGDKKVHLGDMMLDFGNLPASTMIYAAIFFVLGYLLYATIAAMLGSLVSRMEDMNSMLTPLTLVVVVAFMLAMYGLSNPNNILIQITSFIPIFSPMIMFLRVGVGDPALWEVFLSLGLLIATIIGCAVLAAKVYRGGVLMYDKTASLKDIKKAIAMHKDA